jgi:predicted P-loop ATPase
MAEGRPILADYCRAGWHLVPIPLGQKGPTAPRWNLRESCITEPEIAEWLDGNVGLAHAYSKTCAIDVDDVERTREFLQSRGIDLDELLNEPDAVRIESRPGRAKLLYRLDKPLPSFKLPCGLELRCATGTGTTVQDVLPPSIHPDTGKPYEWRLGPLADWSLLPPLPGHLLSLWASLIAPTAPKPPTKPKGTNADKLRAMLKGWDPDMDYQVSGQPGWIDVGMALHHETQGSALGLMVWNEWSSNSTKYKGLGDLELHWRSFRHDHANPRTLASLRRDTAATVDEFEVLPDEPPADSPAQEAAPRVLTGKARERAIEGLRSVKRNGKGIIEARVSNIVSVLGVPEVSGYELAYDEFQDAVMISPHRDNGWRPFTDTDYTQLRVWLETIGNCEPVSQEMARAAAQLVAERQKMDTAKIWIESLKWDGVERISHFCSRYWGTIDDAYTRAVGLYLWTALAGRVVSPGCQCDMVPVLIGSQGIGKSRGVQAMVPAAEHYAELRLDEADDAIARKMRGVLIAELAEMRGLRNSEIERTKAFITRTHEKWTPKYKEFATSYPRRFVIVGTTNDEEFLPSDSEQRRWLPVHTIGVDVKRIREDRNQLWAEALVRYTTDGVHWQGMDELAKPAREMASSPDNWEQVIAQWLVDTDGTNIRLSDVLESAVGLDPRTITRAHELRAGRVLRSLGYVRRVQRYGARLQKVWEFDPTA